MARKSLLITTCAFAAAAVFTGMSLTANAASASSFLPSGGVGLSMTNLKTADARVDLTRESAQDKKIEKKVAEEPSEEDLFRNLVIAKVHDYVNVRDAAGENGNIIGKLYDASVGSFLSEENGWYKIQSGSVTGYVKAEFCVTGEDAVELAKQVGMRLATVTTTTLKVRKEPSKEAGVLGLVPIEEQLVVLDETEGWVKVDVEEGIGWVSSDYVTLHTEFVQAESKAEEEARLAKEAAERQKAREAAAAKAAKNPAPAPAAPQAPAAVVIADGNSSEMGVAVAQYALQFVGNPYVYGGSSLTKGADCSGFVMSVYANFGVSLPHSSSSDRSQGYAVDGGLANAQPGDLVCYSGHVALYIGDGQIVHASTRKTGIIVSKADYKRVLAVRRIF